MKIKLFFRRTGLAALLLFCLWTALPLTQGDVNGGMLFLVPACLALSLIAFPQAASFLLHKNKVRVYLFGILLVLFLIWLIVMLLLISSGFDCLPSDAAGTIIVLGCRVNGTTLSPMLERRAAAALDYWRVHPSCSIIVTGGLSRYGEISEAEALRIYFVQNGVDESLLYLEDRSENTEENLRNSAKIVAEHGLSRDVVIVSDRFHQYRATLFAKENGLTPSPVSCRTPFLLSLSYWLREVLALTRFYLLGY